MSNKKEKTIFDLAGTFKPKGQIKSCIFIREQMPKIFAYTQQKQTQSKASEKGLIF